MNARAYGAIGASIGLVVGAVISWAYCKKQYEERMVKELKSYRKALTSIQESYDKSSSDDSGDSEENVEEDVVAKTADEIVNENYDSGIEIASNYQAIDYTAYYHERACEKSKAELTDYIDSEEDEYDKNDPEQPYVISVEDFQEAREDNERAYDLFLFDDGLITDECWDPIEDIDKIVPAKALKDFIENESDCELYTKNDARKCYYYIEKQGVTYDYFVRTNPVLMAERM